MIGPRPQPGHQMWGREPARNRGSRGWLLTTISVGTAGLPNSIQDDLGWHHFASGPVGPQDGLAGEAVDLRGHLAQVHLRHDKGLHLLVEGGDVLAGEGPKGDETEQSPLDPFFPGEGRGPARRPRRGTERDHGYV